MTLSGGAPIRRPRPRTPLAAQKDARLRIKAPGRHRGSPLLLRASLALLIAGHVSLRDRLPPVQVDRAPAAALRHCLRHHRHRRHLGMGRGRGREVALRQHVGALPGQERRVDLQVAHGLLLGCGSGCSDDHRPHHPHHCFHRVLCGSVLYAQHRSSALHRSTVDCCCDSPGHRSDHLPRQIQRADLRGQLLLHLGLRLWLGRHHPLHWLCHPLLLPAPL